MGMQPIEEDAKEGGAEGAALTHPNALYGWLTSCAINLHGQCRQCAAGVEGLDGCKHARADPNGPQTLPEQVVLHSAVCLLEVDKACIQWPPSIQRVVIEMAQGKKVVDGGLSRPETSLRRAAEATCLSPLHKTVIEDGGVLGVQPVQGLSYCYGLIIRKARYLRDSATKR